MRVHSVTVTVMDACTDSPLPSEAVTVTAASPASIASITSVLDSTFAVTLPFDTVAENVSGSRLGSQM
ncbi:MAG: hypothetical protein OXH19_02235 [Chloroflexi bacterium]|nr:hypothetical protein [Chloroflexota bacterium]